ncbi:DUF7344 domain-containing protein [Natrinema versiforme]|uniref:DUF7344 domain-containing protein n=1 Tax=Natrinema versiforme TaxID=88724 RepID=UPI0009FFE1D8|nr:hypothetical protein [Natrinema versiforme]
MTTDSTNDGSEMDPRLDSLSLDTVYTLLSHNRRRAVLDLLLTHDRALTLTDLRNEVVEWEENAEITDIPGEKVKQVHADLHHVHIPKLTEAGVVIYDTDRNVVEPTEELSQIEPFLMPSSAVSH